MASQQLQADAWVGDAVLCLFGRLRILSRSGRIDGAQYHRMSSNQFLSAFGDPTQAEARLGRIYSEQGLEAAFAWIEEHWMPLFDRQEANRAKGPRV